MGRRRRADRGWCWLAAVALVAGACSTEDADRAEIPSASAPTTAVEEEPADPWAGFETGPPPQIPYLDGDLYVDPRGPDIEIRLKYDHPVAGVVLVGDRWLVTSGAYFEGSTRLHWVDGGRRSGRMHSCVSGSPAVSSSGGRVAWLTYACPETGLRYPPPALHVADADTGATSRVRVAADDALMPGVVGFVGDRLVYHSGDAWILEADGTSTQLPGVSFPRDVHGRLLAGSLGGDREGVTDLRGRHRLTTTYGLDSFSPDGSHLLASGDRGAPVILSAADGSVVTEFDLPRWLSTYDMVWESDQSLLVVETKAKRSHVVRLSLDGTVELATPAREGRRNHPGYVVPEPG